MKPAHYAVSISLLLAAGCSSSQPRPKVDPSTLYLSTSRRPCSEPRACETQCAQQASGQACFEAALYTLISQIDSPTSPQTMSNAVAEPELAQKFSEAANLLATECESSEAVSCMLLGNLHLEGWGVANDQARSLGLMQKACDGGVADACTRIGFIFEEGVAVARDSQRANHFFEIGCVGHDGAACHAMAIAILEGRGAEPDPDRALDLLETSCNHGFAQGCKSLCGLEREHPRCRPE